MYYSNNIETLDFLNKMEERATTGCSGKNVLFSSRLFIILPPLLCQHWAANGCTEIDQNVKPIGVTVHSRDRIFLIFYIIYYTYIIYYIILFIIVDRAMDMKHPVNRWRDRLIYT